MVEDIEGVELARASDLDIETPETALIAKIDARLLEAAIAALPAPFRELSSSATSTASPIARSPK